MPDFPDDVVERVARAILTADENHTDYLSQAAIPEEYAATLAKAALAAAWEWVKAEDAPAEWEGREVWIYEPCAITKVRKGILPFSYSRLPVHCSGAMVMLSITPPPPEVKL